MESISPSSTAFGPLAGVLSEMAILHQLPILEIIWKKFRVGRRGDA